MPKAKLIPMYDATARRQTTPQATAALAQSLMQGDAYPVYNTGQGMLLAGSKMLGGFLAGKAERDEKAADEAAWNPLKAMVENSLKTFGDTGSPSPSSGSSSTGSSGPSPAYSSASGGSDVSRSLPSFARDDMARYAHAIGGIESSQRWDAIGPVSRDGDRPYGKFQVMGKNIGPWTEKWLGQRLTPEQFLADREAQQRVFEGEFGSYLKRFGNPQDAASMWHSGRPLAEAQGRRDILGTRTPDYVQKFAAAAGAGGPPAEYAQGGDMPVRTFDGRPGVEDLLTGGGAQGAGTEIPKPDLRPIQGQIQQALVLMGNPRTRAQGWQMYQQALQAAQQLQAEYRRQVFEAGKEARGYRNQRELQRERIDAEDARSERTNILGQDRLQLDRDKFDHEKGKPLATNQRVLVPDGQGGFREAAPPVQTQQNGIEVGPDGSIKVNPQLMKPPNETQAKWGLFHDRGKAANANLSKFETALTSLGESMATKYGGTLGNYYASDKFQMAKQAADDFLVTILRPDTGAAVTDSEFEIYGNVFLPKPGDKPGVIEQKRKARTRAVEALKQGMTPQQVLRAAVPEEFDGETTVPNYLSTGQKPVWYRETKSAPGQRTPDASDIPPAPKGVDPEVWKFMTPEERKLWN